LEQPLVSVVIPCYNQGDYVEETIDSVLQSDYKNLEIVLVNDGSTDITTQKIIKQMEIKPKIRVYNKTNGGLSSARNFGLKKANGDFILFLDSDDKISPLFISKGINSLLQNNQYAYVYSLVQLFGDRSNVWNTLPYDFEYLLFRNYIPAAIIIRKTVCFEVNGYDETLKQGYEDWEFVIRLGGEGYKGLHINEILFYYRKHEGSMLKGSKKKHTNLRKEIINRHPQLYKNRLLKWLKYISKEIKLKFKKVIKLILQRSK
jgi:glycosyltransferase involved in cell wall biosynthesis